MVAGQLEEVLGADQMVPGRIWLEEATGLS